MGTNYYCELDVCKCCDRPARELHIGKSSFGWCFTLRAYPLIDGYNRDTGETEIVTLEKWVELWNLPTSRIHNEYSEIIPPERMLKIVTERQNYCNDGVEPARHERHRYDTPTNGFYKRGDGQYDWHLGEFS